MKFILQRYSENGESTQGALFLLDGEKLKFLCYTLEDVDRVTKIAGETCIPDGLYKIGFNENPQSPKTIRYRGKFNWFDFHIHIKDVPGFEWIYIHVGNTSKDSEGCILVQDEANNNQVTDGFNGASTPAYKRLYSMITDADLNGEPLFIEVRDIKYLT